MKPAQTYSTGSGADTPGRVYTDPTGKPAQLDGEPPTAQTHGWGDMSFMYVPESGGS